MQPLLPHPLDQSDRQQRMPSQFEEVVMSTDALQLEHLGPDLRQRDLSRPDRSFISRERSAVLSGAGSARRSSFPFGVSGSFSRRTIADGTIYSGSLSLQISLQRTRATRAFLLRLHMPPVAYLLFPLPSPITTLRFTDLVLV